MITKTDKLLLFQHWVAWLRQNPDGLFLIGSKSNLVSLLALASRREKKMKLFTSIAEQCAPHYETIRPRDKNFMNSSLRKPIDYSTIVPWSVSSVKCYPTQSSWYVFKSKPFMELSHSSYSTQGKQKVGYDEVL